MIVIFESYQEFLRKFKNNRRSLEKYGYIYIIEFTENIKIGQTINPEQRIPLIRGNLKNYANTEIKRIFVSNKLKAYKEIEKKMHQTFQDKRINNGELFNVDFFDALRELLNQEDFDPQKKESIYDMLKEEKAKSKQNPSLLNSNPRLNQYTDILFNGKEMTFKGAAS